ncbi:MAG: alpha/beta hydrolase [Actinomycetota bacterium]|nr:alpha/beta hydrolase [Actinomycetota bacterium]
MTYRFIENRWTKVDFTEVSSHPHDHRPPVLLVHGQPGCGTRWGSLPEVLNSKFNVFSYDRPGWGKNRTRAKNVNENAALLEDVVENLRKFLGTTPIVVAYSYGGAIAVSSLTNNPSKYASVLLIAPAISTLAINRYDRILTYPILGSVVSLVTSLFSTKYVGSSLLDIVQSTRSLRIEGINLLQELSQMPSRDLSNVKVSILSGTADFVTPPESIYDGANKYSITSIEWINGGSHLLPWKNSESILSFALRTLSL